VKIPKRVLEVAAYLHGEGYMYAEAYPWVKWQKKGWPDDPHFIKMVDSCLKIMRGLETLPSGSWSDS
jgi:hypothetical protein